MPEPRTIDNTIDVSRKIPATALTAQVLLESEGVNVEEVTGPGANGTVDLSRPVAELVLIIAHDGAGAFAPGGASPAALPVPPVGVDFTATGKTLTNTTARDYSSHKLVVFYRADVQAEQQGGQSAVV